MPQPARFTVQAPARSLHGSNLSPLALRSYTHLACFTPSHFGCHLVQLQLLQLDFGFNILVVFFRLQHQYGTTTASASEQQHFCPRSRPNALRISLDISLFGFSVNVTHPIRLHKHSLPPFPAYPACSRSRSYICFGFRSLEPSVRSLRLQFSACSPLAPSVMLLAFSFWFAHLRRQPCGLISFYLQFVYLDFSSQLAHLRIQFSQAILNRLRLVQLTLGFASVCATSSARLLHE